MTMTIALQNLIVYGVNLADNIMLGAYSETALSGVAIANQVQFLLQMVVTGTASGMGVIISQYWGKRQTEPIKARFCGRILDKLIAQRDYVRDSLVRALWGHGDC